MTELEQARLLRESRRFHMRCPFYNTAVVPQLLREFDVMDLVRVFIREHAGCKAGPRAPVIV